MTLQIDTQYGDEGIAYGYQAVSQTLTFEQASSDEYPTSYVTVWYHNSDQFASDPPSFISSPTNWQWV